MYVTYFLTGFCGVGVVLAGTITTIMRIWDGVTDPFVGMVVDKTNTRFGKNRPFIIIGNVILFVTSGIIYHVTPNLPMAARFPFYIVMYMLYIIGYTCQCVVTKSAQSCLTNDPEQRPYFTIFDSAYNTIIFAVLPVYVTGTLMPKYGGAAAFTTAAFFQELWLFCGVISAIAACMAIIALRRKDRTEFFGTGKAQKIGFKDYVDVISHNRAIQMLVVNASTDKLASSMMSSSVIMVMLYGIICGNYAQYGLMIAAIGFTTTQPTQDTPYSAGIFWVTMACFIGAPMVGWICNLVAMHFYPLSKEFMAEIQEKVAEIKRQAQTENA